MREQSSDTPLTASAGETKPTPPVKETTASSLDRRRHPQEQRETNCSCNINHIGRATAKEMKREEATEGGHIFRVVTMYADIRHLKGVVRMLCVA